MNPFELSGPAFLSLFVFTAFGAAAATLVVRWLVARPARRGDPAEIAARLHPTEVGFLLNGIDRAIEAAVAGLHHRGVIEITAGVLRATDRIEIERELAPEGVYRGVATPVHRTAVEDHVLSHLPATVKELCEAAHAPHVAAELAGELEDKGLLVRNAARAMWLVRLPVLAWLALGGIKVLIGLERNRPIEVLLVLLIGGGWLLLLLARAPRLTSLGQAVARKLRAAAALEATAKTAPQQLSGDEMARAYAIFGHAIATPAVLVVMPSFHAALTAPSSGGGSSCGSSCGSSGSSCGGGGGCGGCS